MIGGFATRQTGLRLCAVRSPGRRSPAVDLSPVQKAVIFAGLGDKERALEALDRMGPVRMGSLLSPPELALLRGDPRLKALRRKAGLLEE